MELGKCTVFFWYLFGLCLISPVICLPTVARNKLIYILMDGFRYDYVSEQPADALPGFNRLLQNGVQAEYLTPIYPSLSYPDWTTLVTGLWAESHGIVGNYIYDPEDHAMFSLYDANLTGQAKWWTAEPIWTTATKADLKTGVIMWSRCDIPFGGVLPDYCKPYVQIKGHQIFKTNVKKALDLLEQGYDFIQVYIEHPDAVGHDHGPDSEELKQAVRDLDPTIVYMLDRIEQMGMTDQVNIIIVSDHGMAPTTPGVVKRVEMDDYLLVDYIENIADAGPFSNIKVKEGYVDKVYEKLKSMPGVEVYRHQEIPDEFNFKNNKYIHDIIVKADIDTFVMHSRSPAQLPKRDDSYTFMGAHGYGRLEKMMQAIFFASGPDFKNGSAVIPPIQNVDVYPLVAHLLNVKPLPNNGTMGIIEKALRQPDHSQL